MTPSWWRPDRLAMRRANLAARARMLGAVRDFFAAAGYLEVDTPALQVSPGIEPHLKAFATTLNDPRDGGARPRYLHTSGIRDEKAGGGRVAADLATGPRVSRR